MLQCVDAGFLAAAMGKNLPSALGYPARIDAGDDSLAAEAVGYVGDDFGA